MNRPVALAVETEEPARFTADEFMDMAAAGAFEDITGKIELVEGVIVRMSPSEASRFHHQRRLYDALHAVVGKSLPGHFVGHTPTVRLNGRTVRDPDLAIIHDLGRTEGVFEPGEFLLVAEISVSTLRKDRTSKRVSYAGAGIPHYWVIDVKGRQTFLYSDPRDGDYQEEAVIQFGVPMPVPGTEATITLD
jgi:Uma2 family endonuclease